MQFALTTRTFVFDHLENETYIVITPFVTGESDPDEVYDRALSDAKVLYDHLKEAEKNDMSDVPLPIPIRSEIICNMEHQYWH